MAAIRKIPPRATYTIPEAAKIIGIGETLCREYVHRGEIPAKKLGKRIVIPKKALERWLEESNNIMENKRIVGIRDVVE